MHPLAHSWARDRLDKAVKEDAWVSTMLLMALSLGSTYEYEDFWRRLQAHVEWCINASPEESFNNYPAIEIGRVFYYFAWLFYTVSKYRRGKELFETLIKKFGSQISSPGIVYMIRFLHIICLVPLAEHGPA